MNDTQCALAGCIALSICTVERESFPEKTCEEGDKVDRILKRLASDRTSSSLKTRRNTYFALDHFDCSSKMKVIPNIIDTNDNSSVEVFRIDSLQTCLCPPSYYGNQCQFQSQRISLTVQFRKECAPNCRGIYGMIVTLIDSDNHIHSYDRFTYIYFIKIDQSLQRKITPFE